MVKLSSAQDSAMRHLARHNGFAPLSHSMLRTYTALHKRGLVAVIVETPVRGYVQMTADGKELYPLRENFCLQCDEPTNPDEAACLHCGATKSWANVPTEAKGDR